MGDTARNTDARIAVSTETRNRLRGLKRGGETYNELFQKMIPQYDPDEAKSENR